MTLALEQDHHLVVDERGSPNKRGYTGFVPAPFDYSQLAANLASEARASAERIKRSQRDHIIEVGLELLKIKERLAHGHFEDWIDRELNFSTATARNYMAAAREFAEAPLTVSVLPPATLYRLAGAAPEVRNQIVARVEAGEYVDREEVDDAIRRPKLEIAKAKKAASEQAEKEARTQRRRERREQDWRQKLQAERERERRGRQEAATKLVRLLADHFDQDAIFHLNRLWAAASFDDVREAAECSTRSAVVGPERDAT